MNFHVSYKAARRPDVEREFPASNTKTRAEAASLQAEPGATARGCGTGKCRGAITSLNLRLPSGQCRRSVRENALAATKSAFARPDLQVTKHKTCARH